MKKKVLVAMSGGVDSSVAALRLQQQGYEVIGAFMKNWSRMVPGLEACSWRQDRFDARRVAVQLELPLFTLDFEDAYTSRVFTPFIREYTNGRTPNPDILCNLEIKFGAFLKYAKSIGVDAIATGHYARIQPDRYGNFHLLKAKDRTKDQSYFLHTLTSKQLPRILFPIGEYTKTEVREIARANGLSTAEKKDSQGLCFVGNVELQTFLKNYIPERRGDVVDESGNVLTSHNGQAYYTIGQRHGLKQGSGIPMYVTGRDAKANTVTVVTGREHPSLFHTALLAHDATWVSGRAPKSAKGITAKIRYRQDDQRVRSLQSRSDELLVCFETPQRAITPGQSIVFYRGEEVLGGAIIDRAMESP